MVENILTGVPFYLETNKTRRNKTAKNLSGTLCTI